jgi:hypothetical protein
MRKAAAWRSRHGPVDVALPLFCDNRRKLRPGLFESGPEPFRSTISPVKSEGRYHLSYRPTPGGLCPKRTRVERTGHPVSRGGGGCSDIAGDWMWVWRPVASGSLWPLRVGLSPSNKRRQLRTSTRGEATVRRGGTAAVHRIRIRCNRRASGIAMTSQISRRVTPRFTSCSDELADVQYARYPTRASEAFGSAVATRPGTVSPDHVS